MTLQILCRSERQLAPNPTLCFPRHRHECL